MRSTSFEIALPREGLLEGLPIASIRPIACDPDVGTPVVPGVVDLWACRYSGVGRVDSVDDGIAQATIEYLDGAEIRTEALAVILDDGELQATRVVPCCGSPLPRIEFPYARSITVSGEVRSDFRFSVDAPGYEHAFAVVVLSSGQAMYDVETDGRIEERGFVYPLDERDMRRPIGQWVWAGAITTEGGPPWSGARPVAIVRRRLVPGTP